MNNIHSLSHIEFIPKYRRKAFYDVQLKEDQTNEQLTFDLDDLI